MRRFSELCARSHAFCYGGCYGAGNNQWDERPQLVRFKTKTALEHAQSSKNNLSKLIAENGQNKCNMFVFMKVCVCV